MNISIYDEAVALPVDLRDLATQAAESTCIPGAAARYAPALSDAPRADQPLAQGQPAIICSASLHEVWRPAAFAWSRCVQDEAGTPCNTNLTSPFRLLWFVCPFRPNVRGGSSAAAVRPRPRGRDECGFPQAQYLVGSSAAAWKGLSLKQKQDYSAPFGSAQSLPCSAALRTSSERSRMG